MNLFDLFGKKSQPTPSHEPAAPQHKEGKVLVHNLIILDESGSMSAIYNPALTGVNETLQTIREAQNQHPDQIHHVSLITFDSFHYNQIYRHIPSEMARDITSNQYRPCGGTPLFDAIGRAVNELRPLVRKGDVVLVTIVTDGYENASSEYNLTMIHDLITNLKTEDWIFTYIGANQDVSTVGAGLGIDNLMEFEANEEGTKEMWLRERSARHGLFGKLSEPDCNISDLKNDYFNN